MRKRVLLVGAIAVATCSALLVAGDLLARQNRYGPVICNGCSLGYPLPDGLTGVFISTYVRKLKQPTVLGPSNFDVNVGDVIVICNGASCVDYVKTDTSWEGTSPRNQVNPPRPGGGNGGGSRPGGGGYSGPISGGGNSGGTVTVGNPGGTKGPSGTVTVGGPQPQRPSRPNQEN